MLVQLREQLTGLYLSSKNADFFLRHRHGFFYQRQLGTPLRLPPFI